MKRLIISILLSLLYFNCFGTKQQNDLIIYKGNECQLYLDWFFPSPFQCYYNQNENLKYPFSIISTANYRGHIATWEIENDVLYLTKITRNNKEIKLKKFFKDKIIKSKVKAEWFTGYLQILSDPFKEWYDSGYSDDKYYVINYKKYVIVKIENGKIIDEKEYSTEQYMEQNKIIHKKEQANQIDTTILSGFRTYISSFLPEDTAKKSIKYYSENDFKLFITRYFPDTIVKVPLTRCCIIENMTFDENQFGYFNESHFIICDTMNVVIIEMGASNVPHGSWDDYVGGAVILVFKINKTKMDTIDVSKISEKQRKLVNNFGGYNYKNKHTVFGILTTKQVQDTTMIFNGVVEFITDLPYTYQKIVFDNSMIPVYSIMNYLELHKNDNQFFPYKPDEKYKKILENTKKYYEKQQ